MTNDSTKEKLFPHFPRNMWLTVVLGSIIAWGSHVMYYRYYGHPWKQANGPLVHLTCSKSERDPDQTKESCCAIKHCAERANCFKHRLEYDIRGHFYWKGKQKYFHSTNKTKLEEPIR